MKDSIRLVVVVTLICLVSALLVSLAHEITLKPIAETAKRQKQEAILAVLPAGAPAFEELSVAVDAATTNIYWKTEKGYAMEMEAPNGYSGVIKLMLGFTREGDFWSYKVLSHSETPGLGAHIAGSFMDNVKERSAADTKWKTTKDGGDIVPITAATISSRAVCDAINRGVKVFEAIQKKEEM
jgi:electron transport complex protein RnfG